jgi:hypothetical protein
VVVGMRERCAKPLEGVIFLRVTSFSLLFSYGDFVDGDALYCLRQSDIAPHAMGSLRHHAWTRPPRSYSC